MVEISYKKNIKIDDAKELIVRYELTSENDIYGVKCLVENPEQHQGQNECEIQSLTMNRKKAEDFVKLLADGEVLPVHVQDIYDDYIFD